MEQVSVNLSPMRDEQGSVNSLVFVMTNITEAAMLQAKLLQAEKMAAIGQLVSGVAHEVNNPLTAILGFADLLADSPEIPPSAKKDLAMILQEAQRTKLIVQNLLSFARKMPPQRQLVQLNSVVRRTLQLRAYDFSNHGVEVVEKLQESLALVLGDPEAPALIAECSGGIISQEQSAGHRKKRRAKHVGAAHEAVGERAHHQRRLGGEI